MKCEKCGTSYHERHDCGTAVVCGTSYASHAIRCRKSIMNQGAKHPLFGATWREDGEYASYEAPAGNCPDCWHRDKEGK